MKSRQPFIVPPAVDAIVRTLSANAEMELQRADNVLAVPESTLEFSGDSAFVYVLTDSVPQQKFVRRAVKTGISDGIKMEIKQGVSAGELIRGLKHED